MRESQIFSMLGGRRILDIYCPACQSNKTVGAVTVLNGRHALTIWAPTHSALPSNAGEPLYAVASGSLPPPGEVVTFHCFRHGDGTVSGRDIVEKLNSRPGAARQRLPMQPLT